MRKRLYDIIEVKEEESLGSTLYDAFMLLTIIASIIPLCFKKQTAYMEIIDQVTVIIFIIDYLLRWSTADYKLKRYKSRAFLYYPFTPMALIDFASILPSLTILNPGWKLLRLFRLVRALRIFKFARYSRSIRMIVRVLRREKDVLFAVGYGDIYPVTVFGKLVSMISSIVGIAVVALPAGVITGGYIEAIKHR